jgi:hypothetical protein
MSTGITRSDTYPNPSKGGQVQIWGLAKQMNRQGNTAGILVRSRQSKLDDDISIVGVHCGFPEYVFMDIITQTASSLRSLREVAGFVPDVINPNFRFSSLATANCRIPKIYVLHVPEALDFMFKDAVRANVLNVPLFYLKKAVESRILDKVDGLVVLNQWTKGHLASLGIDQDRIACIPNAVDMEDILEANYLMLNGCEASN